jgi:hypothetical protein
MKGQGVPVESGLFVGLAPGPFPRLYEGFYDWDVGFLFFANGRLCYVGEQTSFCVRREQICAIEIDTSMPGARRAARVCITWREDGTNQDAAFTLRPIDQASLRHPPRAVEALERRLRAWANGEGIIEAPISLTGLPAPSLPPAAGLVPSAVATWQNVLAHLIFPGFFAGALCVGFGLPFDPMSGGAGWYVMLVVFLSPLVRLVPYWRYRDRAWDGRRSE